MFKIHHIGYIVNNIDNAVGTMINLGYEIKQNTVYDKNRHIDICFLKNEYQLIELIQPKDETAVTYKLLAKTGPAPYHICYQVESIEEACKVLKKADFYPISNIEKAMAMGEKCNVIFLYNQNIGLIELVSDNIL